MAGKCTTPSPQKLVYFMHSSGRKSLMTFLMMWVWLGCCTIVEASIRLPKLISDGMVLQRNQSVKVWGWADPGEEIEVWFLGNQVSTVTDASGKWAVMLPPAEAGGPYTLQVNGASQKILLKDIWMGDVWVTSGQSNMETTMERVSPVFPEEFKQSNFPTIRYFDVPDVYDFKQEREDLVGGKWLAPDAQTLGSFSAVGYFFAKNISQSYGIPIGIVNASVGGSPIQAWLPKKSLMKFPEDWQVAMHFASPGVIEALEAREAQERTAWIANLNSSDKGWTKGDFSWFSEELDLADWTFMPDLFQRPRLSNGNGSGVYWFRKEIELKEDQIPLGPTNLWMGTIVDSDQTYVNGIQVGATGYRYPPRRYVIPSGLLKPGKNVLVVRVVSERSPYEFITEKPYHLELADGLSYVEKDWYFRVGATVEPAPTQTSIRLKPLGLFQAMIAPLRDLAFTGILWYQGESNTGAVANYQHQFHALIQGWRDFFGRPELPFLYVQLPNYMKMSNLPQESTWASMRDIQRRALEIPNTGMAITLDVGEANDIHPLDKQSVGDRLALQAKKIIYGETEQVFSGPLPQTLHVLDRSVRILFSDVGDGLKLREGDTLRGFAMGDHKGRFVWAKAFIRQSNEIEVFFPGTIETPVCVRYAWADNPVQSNLLNSAGLPASTFQLDFK